MKGITTISRHDGRRLVAVGTSTNATEAGQPTATLPRIRIVLIGHFLAADFARCFGRDFYADLFGSRPDGERSLVFAQGKVVGLGYSGGSAFAGAPVVEYAQGPDGSIFEVRLETRDTGQPFGPGSLDFHSQAFLQLPKSAALDAGDKQDMFRTFGEKTAEAYGYAIADVVQTLLIHEQMIATDRQIYRSFGVAEEDIPAMKGTLGSRTARFLERMTRKAAAGSEALKSGRALGQLMKKGGRSSFGGERAASRFGFQAGQVHGGLNFSRSPTLFWHEAPGMIRDVDMSGCYTTILADLDVYWGKPVVHEPGNRTISLSQAVELMTAHSTPTPGTSA